MQQIHSAPLKINWLQAVHRSWGFPSDDELLWLLHQGVDENTLWPISGATVRFDRGTFELDDTGERALTFRATDRGEVVDLVAWQPQTGALASWRGQAFCLGDVDDVLNPASSWDGGALHVHSDPLAWLLANRNGIVMVRPDLAHVYLAHCQRLACSDACFARKLRQWLEPPKPTVEIFLAVQERAAA